MTRKERHRKATKPRVLFVSPLPPPYGGLANNMELYLSSPLVSNYEVITLNLSGGQRREKNPDNPSLSTMLYAIVILLRFIYLLIRVRPDLVYMKTGTKWGFFRDMFIIMICRVFRKKLVCHLHSKSDGHLFLENRHLRLIFRWVMRFPNRVIVLTDNLKREFSDLIKHEKLEVINNIVNASLYDCPVEMDKSNNVVTYGEHINVLFVGRLMENKGIWDLMEAIRIIAAERKDVRFELAGAAESEHQENMIREFCAKAPFSEHVVLLGTISGMAKIKRFLEADIFVFPSYMDNMPNAVLEAFAAGLPVVSSNVAQIPEMVEDGVNGFLVEPGDRKQLVEKLLLLIECSELRSRMGEANYRKAREMYSVEVGVRKMKKVFENVLGENKRQTVDMR